MGTTSTEGSDRATLDLSAAGVTTWREAVLTVDLRKQIPADADPALDAEMEALVARLVARSGSRDLALAVTQEPSLATMGVLRRTRLLCWALRCHAPVPYEFVQALRDLAREEDGDGGDAARAWELMCECGELVAVPLRKRQARAAARGPVLDAVLGASVSVGPVATP